MGEDIPKSNYYYYNITIIIKTFLSFSFPNIQLNAMQEMHSGKLRLLSKPPKLLDAIFSLQEKINFSGNE